jgi:ketosteroid isomerase-like protein
MAETSAERDVLRAFDALFEALTEERNADAGTQLFAPDHDVVMWGSDEPEQAVGQAALGELHRGIAAFSGNFAFRWHERHVHVEGDAAWVNAAGALTVDSPGEKRRTNSYRLTAVFVRRDSRWQWHTLHGSEPAPS